MTSPFTHAPTVKYFEDNGFFGLNASDVVFFQQGWLPCFDERGAVIMQSKHEVATAPDGAGFPLVHWSIGPLVHSFMHTYIFFSSLDLRRRLSINGVYIVTYVLCHDVVLLKTTLLRERCASTHARGSQKSDSGGAELSDACNQTDEF